MNIYELDNVMELGLNDLGEALRDTRTRIENLDRVKWMIERRIAEIMEDRGATMAETDNYMIKVSTPLTYDYNILAQIREIVDPNFLLDCYEPPREKVIKVPEKWNMTKAKKLIGFGTLVRAIIDDAKIPGNPRITLEEKKEEGNRK